MANAYRKVNLQIVFAVKYRQGLLHKSWRSEVFQYITGIINQRNHFSLAVNGVEDHIHIFLDYNCRELIEDLVREIKKASTSFINKNNFCPVNFQWQSGYGVFSHGYREKGIIIEYIRNQEEHHRKKKFREEYMKLLNSYEIDFKDEYVFNFLD